MKEIINWKYDPINTKEGLPSESILYDDDCFMITTHPNSLLSKNLNTAHRVTLLYFGKYKQHRYLGRSKVFSLIGYN